MSFRFHTKFHRHNHHTAPIADPRFPDAAFDPIASRQSPFRGEFYTLDNLVTEKTLSAQQDVVGRDLHAHRHITSQGNITGQNIVIANDGSFGADVFVGQNLTIQGNLSVFGESSVFETLARTTSALVIENVGTGPACTIYQRGEQPIFVLYDEDDPVVWIEGTTQQPGYVGINTTTPNERLTIRQGALSCQGPGYFENFYNQGNIINTGYLSNLSGIYNLKGIQNYEGLTSFGPTHLSGFMTLMGSLSCSGSLQLHELSAETQIQSQTLSIQQYVESPNIFVRRQIWQTPSFSPTLSVTTVILSTTTYPVLYLPPLSTCSNVVILSVIPQTIFDTATSIIIQNLSSTSFLSAHQSQSLFFVVNAPPQLSSLPIIFDGSVSQTFKVRGNHLARLIVYHSDVASVFVHNLDLPHQKAWSLW